MIPVSAVFGFLAVFFAYGRPRTVVAFLLTVVVFLFLEVVVDQPQGHTVLAGQDRRPYRRDR